MSNQNEDEVENTPVTLDNRPVEEVGKVAEPKPYIFKTLHNSDVSGAKKNIPDLVVFGNGDLFQLLSKASSKAEGWMKSTKAMQTPHGCVIQVTTQQKNIDGTYSLAEALTYVPGIEIFGNKEERELIKM